MTEELKINKGAKDLSDEERLSAAQPSIERALSTLHPVEVLLVMARILGWEMVLDGEYKTDGIEGLITGTEEFCEKATPVGKGFVNMKEDD